METEKIPKVRGPDLALIVLNRQPSATKWVSPAEGRLRLAFRATTSPPRFRALRQIGSASGGDCPMRSSTFRRALLRWKRPSRYCWFPHAQLGHGLAPPLRIKGRQLIQAGSTDDSTEAIRGVCLHPFCANRMINAVELICNPDTVGGSLSSYDNAERFILASQYPRTHLLLIAWGLFLAGAPV